MEIQDLLSTSSSTPTPSSTIDLQLYTPPILNHQVFKRLIELDDEDNHLFSVGIVSNYFYQTELLFDDMHQALYQSRDLDQLSSIGGYLLGSTSSLGLERLLFICQKLHSCHLIKDSPVLYAEFWLTRFWQEFRTARLLLQEYLNKLVSS